jgi:hypothetical protein
MTRTRILRPVFTLPIEDETVLRAASISLRKVYDRARWDSTATQRTVAVEVIAISHMLIARFGRFIEEEVTGQ